MRVLVIEDDAVVARSIELMLSVEGFGTELANLGEDGLDLARIYDFDAITLDLSLPDIAGFDVLRRLRASKIKTPVLILTSDAAIETKVHALQAGADDYLTKPFHKDELVARLQALVRRSKGLAENIITTGNLALNLGTKTLKVAGIPVNLTGKEYQMLELMSLRKGVTLTKENFLGHLYGGMDEPEIKIIDVFICKLRKKLNAAGGHPIETVWGRGYKLQDVPGTAAPSSGSIEVADFTDAPPVHVTRMSWDEVAALKFKLGDKSGFGKLPPITGGRRQKRPAPAGVV